MPIGDVYEVIDAQDYRGKEILNTYFYQVSDDGVDATLVADAWVAQVLPEVRGLQSGDVLHVEVRVRNLFNHADATIIPTGLAGTLVLASADTLPTHDAVGFKLVRASASTRHGQKRYAGIPETYHTDGQYTGAPIATAFAALAAALQEQLVDTVGSLANFAVPIIVGRIAETVAGKTTYRLPDALGELVFSLISDVILNTEVTTQNTRKL